MYQAVLLLTCIACAVLGTSIFVRDPSQPANRLASAIVFGGAWWALCEVFWNQAESPEVALRLVKLSALGWVAIGPLGLQLMLELSGDSARALKPLLKALYVAAFGFLLIDWLTPWIHPGMVETSWGWSYELGPVYPLFYIITVTSIFFGLQLAARAYRSWPSFAERAQARGIAAGILLTLLVASVTDGILPFFDVHVMHLGTASIALLGLIVTWTFAAYGDSLLSPRSFASEILETMPDGLALLRLDGSIRHVNPGLRMLLGCEDADELVGRDFGRILPEFEIDASWRDVDCQCLPLEGGAIPVSVTSSTLCDRLDRPTGVVVVIRDMREIVALRQKLMISGRMAAVGQLAAGVAHEINNPMAYVRANLSLLETHWESLRSQTQTTEETEAIWDEGVEIIHESMEGVDRATTIIRDIKTFSHSSESKRELVDLNALLDATQRIAMPQLKHRAVFAADYVDLPHLVCSPREIQQVLLNLIINAADAGGDQDVVTIGILTRMNERNIMVTIEDDGSGIEPGLLERIFDPFFTTKEAGKGTGLGLALSYEIMRRHNGEIAVESRPGQGSRFTLIFPLPSDSDSESDEADTPPRS
jgi:signal transduction histidine kinase